MTTEITVPGASETSKTSEASGNPKIPDFSSIASAKTLESIIKNLRDPNLVLPALRQYKNLPAYDGSWKFMTGKSQIAEIVAGISDARTFMLSYPSAIVEFHFDAKNPDGPDSQNRFGYRNKTVPKGTKVPETGIPIPYGTLGTLVGRTFKIVSEFFENGNSSEYAPDTVKSRAFFERCFALCDGDPTETERIRLKMKALDELLSAGPKKMLPAPETGNGNGNGAAIENPDAEKETSVAVPNGFLEREFDFKNASEWKILKELRAVPSQELSLSKTLRIKPSQAADIAESISALYVDKIAGFIEDAKTVIARGKMYQKLHGEVSKWDYSKPLVPVEYLDPRRHKGEAGFSSPKKGTFGPSLFVNYLTEVHEKIHGLSDDEWTREFGRIVTERMGIYFPDDVVRDAFLGREWALEASKALGIDIGTVPEVRIARMNVDDAAVGRLAEENADRLLSEIRTAKSEDTAGLFAKYSEFRLFHVNERNRTKRNELDGAISDYLLISAHRRENVTGRDEPSVFWIFWRNPDTEFSREFYGNPKVAEAFAIHLRGKNTAEAAFPAETALPDTGERFRETVPFYFLAWVGTGTYYSKIRKPYLDMAMEKEWASWDEAAKVGHDVLSVHRGLRAEGPEISGFLLSIPEGSVSDKKRLVRLYKHYERSEIADAVAGKIRSVFAASEEGKAVASLLESEAMDEDGAKKVLEAFVSDCEK